MPLHFSKWSRLHSVRTSRIGLPPMAVHALKWVPFSPPQLVSSLVGPSGLLASLALGLGPLLAGPRSSCPNPSSSCVGPSGLLASSSFPAGPSDLMAWRVSLFAGLKLPHRSLTLPNWFFTFSSIASCWSDEGVSTGWPRTLNMHMGNGQGRHESKVVVQTWVNICLHKGLSWSIN